MTKINRRSVKNIVNEESSVKLLRYFEYLFICEFCK